MKRLFTLSFLTVLLVSVLVLPAFALGSVVDNYTTLSGYSVIITGYWNQAGSTNAWAIKTIPNATGTAQSLTMKLMKTGSPVGYWQYDLYNSSMVLVDWSIGYTIASISGVRKTNYNKAFTQNYAITNGSTYYVGIRAINATTLDSNNYIEIDYDGSVSETLETHIGTSWLEYSSKGIYFIFYATLVAAQTYTYTFTETAHPTTTLGNSKGLLFTFPEFTIPTATLSLSKELLFTFMFTFTELAIQPYTVLSWTSTVPLGTADTLLAVIVVIGIVLLLGGSIFFMTRRKS